LQEVRAGAMRVRVSNGWVAYPAVIAGLFIAFLLMVFIPTLRDIASVSVGNQVAVTEYDPHPY
jgi:hypothetical protein